MNSVYNKKTSDPKNILSVRKLRPILTTKSVNNNHNRDIGFHTNQIAQERMGLLRSISPPRNKSILDPLNRTQSVALKPESAKPQQLDTEKKSYKDSSGQDVQSIIV